MTNEEYMSLALDLAREAAEHGEVPVGCVIADAAGRVIGRGRNRREELGDATAHAEVEAIRGAGAALGSWRLEGCTMYVTLEPCPMCTGAIINSRIPCLVFGVRDAVTGFEHVALVAGEPKQLRGAEDVLVRVHSECLTGDVFGSRRFDCGDQLHRAMAQIEKEGRGVILYMRQEGRGIGLIN